MNTRACFCSNIKKSRHILDWTRTSISELSVRHSAIELHLQNEDNLFAVSVFYGAGYRSRTGDFSMARRRVAATPNPQ